MKTYARKRADMGLPPATYMPPPDGMMEWPGHPGGKEGLAPSKLKPFIRQDEKVKYGQERRNVKDRYAAKPRLMKRLDRLFDAVSGRKRK